MRKLSRRTGPECFHQQRDMINVSVLQSQFGTSNRHFHVPVLAHLGAVIECMRSGIIKSQGCLRPIWSRHFYRHSAMPCAPGVKTNIFFGGELLVDPQAMFVSPKPDELLSGKKLRQLSRRFGIVLLREG